MKMVWNLIECTYNPYIMLSLVLLYIYYLTNLYKLHVKSNTNNQISKIEKKKLPAIWKYTAAARFMQFLDVILSAIHTELHPTVIRIFLCLL